MDKDLLIPLVESIRGCTFATLDALTEPKPGILCRTTRQNVIIYRTSGASGWENRIKKLLSEAGLDPDTFKVGPLPWGTRMGNLPILTHNGKFYLQTIPLAEGKVEYYMMGTGQLVEPSAFGIRPNRGYTGLPKDETVKMKTYNIENITKITLLGKTLAETKTAQAKNRSILSIKV